MPAHNFCRGPPRRQRKNGRKNFHLRKRVITTNGEIKNFCGFFFGRETTGDNGRQRETSIGRQWNPIINPTGDKFFVWKKKLSTSSSTKLVSRWIYNGIPLSPDACLPLSPVVSRCLPTKKKSTKIFDLAIRRYNTFSEVKIFSTIFTLSPRRAPTEIGRRHLEEFCNLVNLVAPLHGSHGASPWQSWSISLSP